MQPTNTDGRFEFEFKNKKIILVDSEWTMNGMDFPHSGLNEMEWKILSSWPDVWQSSYVNWIIELRDWVRADLAAGESVLSPVPGDQS